VKKYRSISGEEVFGATFLEKTCIIDVRSPKEYDKDHIPGALNLPVLDNDGHHEIGCQYVQESKFEARKRGAIIISRKIADHLEQQTVFQDRNRKFLIYCARGGLRSVSFALILKQIGFELSVLEGGYKNFRRMVREALSQRPDFQKIVVHGPSGSGKTHILKEMTLKGQGYFLDLEDLARHRGSRFGALNLSPRRQSAFENHLYFCLESFKEMETDFLFVEGESRQLGHCHLPGSFFSWMKEGPHLWVDLPREIRAVNIVEDYLGNELTEENLGTIKKLLQTLVGELPKKEVGDLLLLAERGDFQEVAFRLLESHFDPHYERHREKQKDKLAVIQAKSNADLKAKLLEFSKTYDVRDPASF
jgi:tRNA 2-selenouridine synthase